MVSTMDPQKEEKLKQSAEALAYHLFAFVNALQGASKGLDSGIRLVEQSFGPFPVALPPVAGLNNDKKPKSARKVRPALRPSGGSGIGPRSAHAAGGSPTMLALLEDLDKELHGDTNAANNKPLVTPAVPDAAAVRLSDVGVAAAGAGAAGAPNSAHPLAETPHIDAEHDSEEHGSENGEVGGSNEAGEDADAAAATTRKEGIKPENDEFSFDDPMSTVKKPASGSPAGIGKKRPATGPAVGASAVKAQKADDAAQITLQTENPLASFALPSTEAKSE